MPGMTVLFAFDGSPHARTAIERAGTLLKPGPAVVATAWTTFEEAAPGALLAMPGDMVREAVADLDDANREQAENAGGRGRRAGARRRLRGRAARGPLRRPVLRGDRRAARTSSTRARSCSARAGARRWPRPCSAASRPACCTTPSARSWWSAERRTGGGEPRRGNRGGGALSLTGEIRAAAARVAARARHVRIVPEAIEPYAAYAAAPRRRPARPEPGDPERPPPRSSRSTRSTSAAAGSRPCASRPASPASARSRPA